MWRQFHQPQVVGPCYLRQCLYWKGMSVGARPIKEAVFVGLIGMGASFGCMLNALIALAESVSSI